MATAPVVTARCCTKCFVSKPELDFPTKTGGKRRARCKECQNAYNRNLVSNNPALRQKKNLGAKNWRANNLQHVRAYAHDRRLRLQYGIRRSDYLRLFEEQNGVCAICQSPPKKEVHLYVDHCHETGRIRGLLCSSCNLALGMLGDTVATVSRALAYLAAEPIPQSMHDIIGRMQ